MDPSRNPSWLGFEQVAEAAAFLAPRLGEIPRVAVVLGSGLGGFTSSLDRATTLAYGEIPHWPVSRVVGHAGTLVVGGVGARRVVALSGRVHLYEGHDVHTVSFAMRVLWKLGVPVVIVTNAAGGINTALAEGALMVIDDHINLMGLNPLVGPNDERFGARFPDMTAAYSARLRDVAHREAARLGVPLAHGVYAGLLGPSYETPAEIRYLRAIGADAVGMSTVPEVIAARHVGLEVLGISCITNMAAGVLDRPLHHDEVMQTAARVRDRFAALVRAIIEAL